MPGENNPRWDISLEALWLERDTGTGVPLGFTSYADGSQAANGHNLWSDDVLFPLAPGIRLQLVGRITDQMAIEAIGWGLQQWSVGRTIYGDPESGVVAYSPWLQAAVFDNSLGYTYTSQVANVELNQRLKLFSIDPYRAFSWLWGVRYLYLSDDFALSGSDLLSGSYEQLNWQTKNNLLGMQLGLHWAWGWDRVELSSEIKAGLFANAYSQHGTDPQGMVGFQSSDVSHSNTDLSALFELSVALRCRITSCMWLKAGYQYYGMTGLALGPRQLGGYDASGTLGLDGLSIGLELTR